MRNPFSAGIRFFPVCKAKYSIFERALPGSAKNCFPLWNFPF